jgi:hypothetical protein
MITSHTNTSNSSSGHNADPLDPRNSSEVNSRSRILSYPLGTDHAQKKQFYFCVAQTTQKTSPVTTISPVHWLTDCGLATSYKHSSYCYVTIRVTVFIAPLPCNEFTCHNTLGSASCPNKAGDILCFPLYPTKAEYNLGFPPHPSNSWKFLVSLS